MKFTFFITVFIFTLATSAQYEVLEAKKVRMLDGSKVRKGDFLVKHDTIVIDTKGNLTLDVESAMHMKLASGTYIAGDESKRHNEWYDTHLALTKELKVKGMITCKFRYKTLAVPGSSRHYEIDRIELDQTGIASIDSDTTALTVTWVNPDYRYTGGYHLVLRDFYNNGFIDIIQTNEKTITFYPGAYGHKHMYYNIIADDCRASLRFKIQVNTPEARINKVTNFTN